MPREAASTVPLEKVSFIVYHCISDIIVVKGKVTHWFVLGLNVYENIWITELFSHYIFSATLGPFSCSSGLIRWQNAYKTSQKSKSEAGCLDNPPTKVL